MAQGKDPKVKKRAFMFLGSKDLRKALKKNPQLGDEWVKTQLKGMGKDDLYFDGVADAIRNNDVVTEKSYHKLQDKGGPLETRKRVSMALQTKSIKRRLEEYADNPAVKENPDAYVKSQLEKHNKGDYYYDGVAQDILNGNVGTESSYVRSKGHQEFVQKPENAEIEQRIAKRHGKPYATKFSQLTPEQEALQNQLISMAMQKTKDQYSKIGQPTQLEQPVNDLMQKILQQYQQGTIGNEYLSGVNGVFPGLQQNLQGLGQGAQQLGQAAYGAGQGAYNTLNPYLQAGMQKGQQLASQAAPYLNPQPYLSAAQPYAQKAADLGSDILSSIRGPAVNAGKQTMEGLGNLLSMLKGRV